MEKEEFDIEKEYELLREKHNLPKFEEISQDFDIEKNLDKESIFPLREIRRTINEKIAAYTNLFETLINPTTCPIFIFSILRTLEEPDK